MEDEEGIIAHVPKGSHMVVTMSMLRSHGDMGTMSPTIATQAGGLKATSRHSAHMEDGTTQHQVVSVSIQLQNIRIWDQLFWPIIIVL